MNLATLTEQQIRHRHRKILQTVDEFNRTQRQLVAAGKSEVGKINLSIMARTLLVSPSGKIIEDREFESKSFVANVLSGLYCYLFQGGHVSSGTALGNFPDGASYGMLDTGGTVRNGSISGSGLNASEGFNGAANYGIVFGIGNITPAPTQYALANRIAGGTGTGNLFYYDMKNISITVTVGQTVSSIFQRIAINETTAPISIAEMGLICNSTQTTARNFLLVRDLVSPITSVGSGYAFIGQYAFSVTT